MAGNVLDIRRDPGDHGYSVGMACTNCSWQGTVMISRGQKVPRTGFASSHCPNCGCVTLAKTIDQRPRL